VGSADKLRICLGNDIFQGAYRVCQELLVYFYQIILCILVGGSAKKKNISSMYRDKT